MSEWREYELREVLDIVLDNRGRNPLSYNESGIPVIDNFMIQNQRSVNLSEAKRFIDDETFDEFIRKYIQPKDVLITLVGNGFGNVSQAPKDKSVIIQNTVGLRGNNKIDNEFLFYNLKFNNEEILKFDRGAVQPSIKVGDLKSLNISLPPLKEQKAIAEVLSSLDDKIDLLHRQNKTLEALAQTLFRQWFIEEAEEGWEIGKLPDEFDFIMGLSPKGETFNEDEIGTPMYQGNADFEFRFPKNRVYTTDPKRYAEKFDTLISVRAPVGAQNMAKEKCCIGRGVASFRYKADNSFYTYTYFKMKSLMDEIKQFNDSGTVFGSINKTDFLNIDIIIPPNDKITKFQNKVKPMDDKVIKNTLQIKTLESMRDTLLPKLMSGEVRVVF